MSFLEKIKFSLFYDGLTKEDYKSLEPYIIKENNNRLRIYNIVGFLFVFSLFIFSLIWSGFASKTFVYLGVSLCNVVVILLLYSKAQYDIFFSKILNYLFSSLMMFFTMYIGTIKNNGLPATTFYAALAIVPYITYNKLIYSFIHRLIFLLIFIAMSVASKSPEYVQVDIINGVSVFVLSTLAGGRVQRLQVNGFVMTNNMDKELKKMSGVFENIRIIDLSSNTSADYSTNSDCEKRIIDTNKNASGQMDKFVEDFVADNNKIHMRQFCDLSTLEDRIYSKKMLICDFATTENTWCRATFVSMEDDSKGFAKRVVFTIQRIADSYYLDMLDFDLNKIK